jgi:ubiquitin-conjugating enzyme E2 Z
MQDETTKVVIPKETVTRLLRDIRDVMTDTTLSDCGIMYRHSETDILTGYACIVGPSDTLYFGGYYFFVFKFPTNYPHSPPVVSFITNTGNIRFHPNFYANKKVCVSIVNTWRGAMQQLVIEKMQNALPQIEVPIIAEFGFGKNWFEAH